jgi:hypothetical protein
MLVSPVTTQLKVLLEQDTILVGLAVKELITGLPLVEFTVTVAVDVTEPAALVAVSV